VIEKIEKHNIEPVAGKIFLAVLFCNLNAMFPGTIA